MTIAAATDLAAADSRPRRGFERTLDRTLVWLPALAAAAAVALYLAVHRDLVLAPAGALLAALAAGPWSPALSVPASFFVLLLPPTALLLALAAAIWPWSRLYHPSPTLRLLATAVSTSAAVVLLQVCLGAGGLLRPQTLAVVTVALTVLLLIAGRARRRAAGPPGRPPVPGPLTGGHPLARIAARLDLAAPSPLGLALGGLTAISWLALAVVGSLTPPWGWDTLVYHLTDVFWFAQTGGLEPFPHPLHQFHFPKVAELHSLWFYLLAGGGEGAWRVTGIAQLPLALTAGVAVRAAAELLGLRAALAWLVPAMMLVPLALIQPLAGYGDLAFAGFLLAGFAFLLAALKRGRPTDWGLAALACGLALGSKLSFVYLCLPLVVLLMVRPRRIRLTPRSVALLPAYAALFAVGCGLWMIPNLLRTGNPFYPVSVTVGGYTLLEGPAAVATADSNRQRYVGSLPGWLVYPFQERFMGKLGYSPDNGFGPQFAAACLALPFALVLALRRRRRFLLRALLAAPALTLSWLALSPWEHPRYVLAACGFALLALASVEEEMVGGPAPAAAARTLLRATLVIALLFAAPAGLFAAAPELPQATARWRAGGWSPRDLYPLLYGPAGSAFNWISDEGGTGTTVSFDRATFVAPLFGWHGQNRVVYAATMVEAAADAMPFAATGRSWQRFLGREGVDWIVVWKQWWDPAAKPTIRERWIAAADPEFTELASFGAYARVLAPPAAPPPASPYRALDELSAGDGWVVEYATGAEASVATDPAGGLRIDYRFLSAQSDYMDLRFDLVEGGWPADAQLVLSLDTPGGSPLLWLHLKEADARRSSRYRIEPRRPQIEPGRVRLALAHPDARTRGFATRRVATVHLVLDDDGSPAPSTGSFRLYDFRLEPAIPGPPAAGPSPKEGP